MKYSQSESDIKYEPKINLNCPDRILIFSDGLIHMINITLELNKPLKTCSNSLDISYISRKGCTTIDESIGDRILPVIATSTTNPQPIIKPVSEAHDISRAPLAPPSIRESTKPETIVARIIADFAECETADSPSQEKYTRCERTVTPTVAASNSSSARHFDELVITCSGGTSTDVQPNTSGTPSSRVRLISHRSHRQIAANNLIKAAGNIKTVDLQSTTSATIVNKNLDKAAKAYEFSEDNEKCEKISTFRKRRLAEKKYEFSEDNSENIIPFAKLRSTALKSFSFRARQHAKAASLSPSSHHSLAGATSIDVLNGMASTGGGGGVPLQPPPPHTHRASPSHGFRSPCGSPVGNRYIMSPPGRTSATFCGRSPTYAKPFSSPHRSHIGKHSYFDAIAIENPLLSPRSIGDGGDFEGGTKSNSSNGSQQQQQQQQPLSEVRPSNIYVMFGQPNNSSSTMSGTEKSGEKDKPICAKKLVRRYVEEDDATSVITSEEGMIILMCDCTGELRFEWIL